MYVHLISDPFDHYKSTSFESYDPESNEWTKLAPTNKTPVGRCDLFELNGFLYTIMGRNGTVERYDPCQNRWTEVCEFKGLNAKR